MLQKDREASFLILRLEEAGHGQKGEPPELVQVRPDIRMCILRGGEAPRLYLECAESVLVFFWGMPGGEGVLPGGTFFALSPGARILSALPPRGLVLCITEARLLAILAEDADTLPGEIRAALALGGRAGQPPGRIALTPDQLLAGQALMNCSHQGAVRNIFIKGKILELIALFFLQLLRGERRGAGRLSPGDSLLVSAAREYFFARLDSPPTIRQMARHAGTNETKLKRLFKDAYGLSVHAQLRWERMAAARGMLLHQGVNVSEAALAVGYNNVSHFINAFTRQYGLRPGEMRSRR
ncbi:MAG: AraC family transcriptional regulator [Deltaproteobacteria bacterium]|jgi:AraC-like DNA-binding protein|nr:AraC family transcriptional regulator [Deltaproteobacteria bacterium]